MLSYRHSFHAGNFADVLKHSVLIHILEHLKKKEKPFCYVDTHAGAGRYSLNSEHAEQTQEYQQGIAKLWQAQDLPPIIADYVQLVQSCHQQDALQHYPGSPLIAKQLMRPQDQLFLYELHSTDVEVLRTVMQHDRRVHIYQEDGFKHSVGLLPPPQRRGLVLMDPSYELKTDYTQVLDTIIQLHKRFATGTYALWYPVVERERINQLEQRIQASTLSNVQLFELGQLADNSEWGMTASGMIVINPPWTLKAAMGEALPYLAAQLGVGAQGHYRIKQLKDE
ncbi:MAG: 23S rRNA (adenine2030-N6)-methyltransferase [Methyloprofundus sp.]|nr:MAG: 23S rRNA (adenine2030-N6)-methyltransferase [Methyloprofundus sp.]